MTVQQFAALMGFAFVAAVFGLGLGAALLCLLVATLTYGGAAVAIGELDPEELRDRFGGARSGLGQPQRRNPPR